MAVLFAACAFGTILESQIASADVCGGGVGLACINASACMSNTRATVCVSGKCAIPCVDNNGQAVAGNCGMGETCAAAEVFGSSQQTYVCKTVPMVMDLNLLDTCIYQFVQGPGSINPAEIKECSTQSLLLRMLDRDANGLFNIFDVDGCIADFLNLYSMPCDDETQTCDNGQTYCDFDEDCGQGSYCDEKLRFCRRECGFVVDRGEPGTANPVVLDRPCYGRLQTCDYSRGKCVKVDLDTCPPEAPDCHACQIDAQCPTGSYCFVGKCTAKCNSALDCPDASWYCSKTNTCLPRPRNVGSATVPFDPKNYSILLTEREVSFSVTRKTLDLPVLIMDLAERRPVFDNPNVVFGYRLETKYSRKQDPICLSDFEKLYAEEKKICAADKICVNDWEKKRQAVIQDCIIDSSEEFVTMENPFGVIYGDGDPRFRLSLNMMAFDKLSPGLYEASFTAMFNNGDMDTIKVLARKPSPSGEYFGQLAVYLDRPKNLLGQGNLGAKLYVATGEPMVEWNQFLVENNLSADKDFEDFTRGYPVRGTIHGNAGMLFDNPKAIEPSENEVPIKGIYSPHLGRMRLIAVVDTPLGHCKALDGECLKDSKTQIQVNNRFGRQVQRIAQFIGPFDPLEGIFHGYYRETVSGLLDWDVTLSGDFKLALMTQEETNISQPALRDRNVAVGFPSDATIATRIDTDINKNCSSEYQSIFSKQETFENYLRMFPDSKLYPQLTEMTGVLQDALATLNGNFQSYLTFNEFLAGKAGFCTPSSNAKTCVDKAAVTCGLALQRKAFVANGWVDVNDLEPTAHALFCDAAHPIPDCQTKDPALVTLQEHNRFYQQLVQTYALEAGNALSDGFYVMHKAAAGTKLNASSAYDYKVQKLQQALTIYDEARSALYSPEATAAMSIWPMQVFTGKGNDWLNYLEVASTDRMTTILELLDLQRRVQNKLDSKAEVFASHLLHDEYLTQVLLLALRQKWQGAQMTYTGAGPRMMEQGDLVLAKVRQVRNPLGLHDNRVFFENSDLISNNWQNFRNRVSTNIAQLEAATSAAIGELRASLIDQDNLENSLQTTAHQAQQQMDDLCGPKEAYAESFCDAVTEEQRKEEVSCDPAVDGTCDSRWVCEQGGARSQKDCDTPAKVFKDGASVADQACRVDTLKMPLKFAGETRQCVRGRMGVLIQERKSLEIQKDSILKRFDLLMRQIAREQKYIKDVSNANEDLLKEMAVQQTATAAIMEGMSTAETLMGIAEATYKGLQGGDFTLAAAVATGATVWGAANALYTKAMGTAKIQLSNMEAASAAFQIKYENHKEMLLIRKNLDELMDQVEVLLIDYDTVVQQIANLSLQMDDTLYLAKQAAHRYEEQVKSIVDHLIGRESGSVLLRNQMVAESNALFQEALVETYKMAQAFIHRYNKGEASRTLVNQVYRLQTSADLKAFVQQLEQAERDYCGSQAVDCDFVNNTKMYRLSLRDTLFPNLRDIVDAKTGSVLTKGQQFHNIITSSPQFVQRNKREDGVRTEIVLPFAIWMQNTGSAARSKYMVRASECNHILVGKRNGGAISAGTIAVNVAGNQLAYPVEYELWRGNTDYLRSCTEKTSPYEPKVNVFTVGFSEKSTYGKMDTPPDFITHTGAFQSCTNNHALDDPNLRNNEDGCFNYFARDRSLGAPDWKLVIPSLDVERSLDNGGQSWILGEKLPENKRPVVEDIVLYFRYNAQPIN
jgi:hypothetical protein